MCQSGHAGSKQHCWCMSEICMSCMNRRPAMRVIYMCLCRIRGDDSPEYLEWHHAARPFFVTLTLTLAAACQLMQCKPMYGVRWIPIVNDARVLAIIVRYSTISSYLQLTRASLPRQCCELGCDDTQTNRSRPIQQKSQLLAFSRNGDLRR